MKPLKYRIILANLLLTIAAFLTAFGIVALTPLVKVTMNSTHASVEAPAPAIDKETGLPQNASLLTPEQQETATQDARQADMLKSEQNIHKRFEHYRRKASFASGFLTWLETTINDFNRWIHSGSLMRFVSIYITFILFIFIIKGLFQFLGDYIMGKVSVDVSSDLMRRVYENVLRQEMLFFNNTSTGSLLNTCYREIFQMQPIIKMLASTRVILPISMMMLFFAMVAISVPLSALLLVLLPIVILPTMLITRNLKESLKREIGEESQTMDVMNEGFQGILAIKAYNAEKQEMNYLEPTILDYVRFTRARRMAQSMTGPIVDALNMFILVTVFVLATFFMKDLNPDRFLVFMIAIQQFYKPMRSMMTMNVTMQRAQMLARRVFAMLDREPEIMDMPGAIDFPYDWSELIFDNVSLSYKVTRKNKTRMRTALVGAHMSIRRGESIALIGPNGAGKSSVVNLICRLYDRTDGDIRFDGIPIEKIRLAELRRNICLVTQHPILFNRTVRENISLGMDDLSDELIHEAARVTNAAAFIENLPHGYDTHIGENGRLLSGGERQKLVLARAFVRQPQILILDEPTTGLDYESLVDFLNVVKKLRERNMTIIYITHERNQQGLFDRVFRLTPEKNIIEAAPDTLVPTEG